MAECLALLRRGEVEDILRLGLGTVPHQRWKALLGRADSWGRDAGSGQPMGSEGGFRGGGGSGRTMCLLKQFREDRGCALSDEWRKRSRLRQGASEIELTLAERAATTTAGPTGVVGLGVCEPAATGQYQSFAQALPSLAASLAEASDGGDDFLCGPTGVNVLPAGGCGGGDTSEVLSFFLEVSVTERLDFEHTLIAAALPTTGPARFSLRPVVGETYSLSVPCYGLEGATCSPESLPLTRLGKRPASWIEDGGLHGEGARPGGGNANETLNIHPVAKRASMRKSLLLGQQTETQLHTAVQMASNIIPFARLQHALLRVGTGLSLDFHDLNDLAGTAAEHPCCAVLLAGEAGWSNPEVVATSATVSFVSGHIGMDRWEWNVALGSGTLLMDYDVRGCEEGAVGETVPATMKLVREKLPLVQHIVVQSSSAPKTIFGGGQGRGKCIKFCFSPAFSVHAMCRSFALAGEGLGAMRALAAQAAKQMLLQSSRAGDSGGAYAVVSCSPIHVAIHDASLDQVVLLTHSAFSAKHISSAERPGLVLIPLFDSCPRAAMRELEAAVTKHRDLGALLHGLSRTVAVMTAVSRSVPDVAVGRGLGAGGDRASGEFVVTPVSPACFVLSARGAPLTLMAEAGGQVRVSGMKGSKDRVVANTVALQELLREWIASIPASS